MSKEQTLLEKTVSLIRFSFDENAVESISKKIRHFYDLYFLVNNPECAEFVASDSFKKQFDTILQHDREIFEEPRGWQTKPVVESPLLNDFSTIWDRIKAKYQTELSFRFYQLSRSHLKAGFISIFNPSFSIVSSLSLVMISRLLQLSSEEASIRASTSRFKVFWFWMSYDT